MNTASAECMRWRREPGQWLILLTVGLAWLAAGVLGGWAAADQRAAQLARWQQWEQQFDKKLASALASAPTSTSTSASTQAVAAKRAADVFDLGRHLAPRVALPGGPGLALAPRPGGNGATEQAIGIETRHFDARKAEPLHNPGLAAAGCTSLAWLIAVLLPLALISACHGVVLGDRDAGRWRWIVSLAGRPWPAVLWAVGLRAGALLLLAAAASALALGLDGAGTTAAAWWTWCAALSGFVVAWMVCVLLVLTLPLTASGGTLLLIGAWVLTTFALPALLGEAAHAQAEMPSRLFAVVESRKILQAAETRNDDLLAAWYQQHPEWRPARMDTPHAWPVSFVPRYLEIDRGLRPLMAAFDAARVRQAQRLDARAWLSPALALIQRADVLAGHTAQRQARYARELERREDLWRNQLVPAVMSYRGLSLADAAQLKALGRPAAIALDNAER